MNSLEQKFYEISPYDIEKAVKLIGRDWMLITVADGDSANVMTASWGCMGVLWNKPVATVFIRPQRYTFSLTEKSDRLSLAFFDESFRDVLSFCGSHSGRDCNKIDATGLSISQVDGVPAVAEASLILICRKLYADDLKPECFIDRELLDNYKKQDYHRAYILEIEKALIKK